MSTGLTALMQSTLNELRKAGQYKQANELQSAQAPMVTMDGRETIMLSSNNYLGLANDPRVMAAGQKGIEKYGLGTASVRFITGTMSCHLELEEKICAFLGCEAALTYMSCWDANIGLIPTLAGTREDAIFTDQLNHASIIDAVRLSKAARNVYTHSDYTQLADMLEKSQDARIRLIVSDGVFSMEGDTADIAQLADLADRYDAVLVVDESHATGVLGATGRGTAEHCGVGSERIIQTSTLGKALGGACGGYVAGSTMLKEFLLQKSRPHLFSNALPPAVCCGASEAISILMAEPERLSRLRENVAYFRKGIAAAGLRALEGETPIVPIILGETEKAIAAQKALFERGVFVSGFGFPVVPKGEARLRAQICATHTTEHLDRALAAFADVLQ